MAPTAHTIVISPGTKLVTIPSSSEEDMEFSGSVTTIPKYAIGLFDANGSGPRKRKRLTHLTPEEKIMRRKLKNRVAAQTARDRKRMRLENLEETVQKVQKQARVLLDVNQKLLERAESLERENAGLRKRLGLETENNATVAGNRQTVERIKVEFESIDDSELSSSFPYSVSESNLSLSECSDDIDSPPVGFDSTDVTTENRVQRYCPGIMECESPEPAAGSCQTLADPLQSCQGNFSTSVSGGNQADDDILGLLENIDTSFDSRCGSRLDVSPSNGKNELKSVNVGVIKDLISLDHLYSKQREEKTQSSPSRPRKPHFKIQLSRRSLPSTKLIKQPNVPVIKVDLTADDDNKPVALYEDSARNRAPCEQSKDATELAISAKTHPMMCDLKSEAEFFSLPDASSVLDLDNLDAELDNILNNCTADSAPLISPVNCLDTADLLGPPISDSSICGSPASSYSSDSVYLDAATDSPGLDTPPFSDLLDPFDSDFRSFGSVFSDPLSTDLFPQLAAVI